MAAELPALAGARDAAPPPDFRIAGEKVARKPARYSGRTAMTAHVSVVEPEPPDDPDSAADLLQEGPTRADGRRPCCRASGRRAGTRSTHCTSSRKRSTGRSRRRRSACGSSRPARAPAAPATPLRRRPPSRRAPGEWLRRAAVTTSSASDELSARAPASPSARREPYVALGEARRRLWVSAGRRRRASGRPLGDSSWGRPACRRRRGLPVRPPAARRLPRGVAGLPRRPARPAPASCRRFGRRLGASEGGGDA